MTSLKAMSSLKKVKFTLLLNILLAGNNFAVGNKPVESSLKTKTEQFVSKQNSFIGFKENKGQFTDSNGDPAEYILFKTEAPNLNIWVTTKGLTYQFYKVGMKSEQKDFDLKPDHGSMKWERVDMTLKNASIQKENIEVYGNISQGEENYYLGHCPEGIFHVKTYIKIIIKEIYAGIDWVLYTSDEAVKYDFVVHPGSDPDLIKLIYEGSGKFSVKNNRVHFENKLGQLTEGQLVCHQGSLNNIVSSGYTVVKNTAPLYIGAGNISAKTSCDKLKFVNKNVFTYEVAIRPGNYDATLPLIIDPQLFWATLVGGHNNSDVIMSIDCDNAGNVYGAGYAISNTFPVQSFGSAYNQAHIGVFGNGNAVIVKFSNTGALIWSTYYGGSGGEQANSIDVDAFGNIYVGGYTRSTDFPLLNLTGAYNQIHSGGTQNSDAFILCFTSNCTRSWATVFGGAADGEMILSLTTDLTGNLFVTGSVANLGLPGAGLPIQSLSGAYNQTTIGGNTDAFIAKFSVTGACIWSTYYGGSRGEEALSIDIDVFGNIFVAGYCAGGTFPLQNWTGAYNQPGFGGGPYDCFILKFDNNGNRQWASFYGGNGEERGLSIMTDSNGNVFLMGYSTGGTFPIQNWPGAYNKPSAGGMGDIFIARFSNTGTLTWSSYYGGGNWEATYAWDNLEIDTCDNIYITFNTNSPDVYTKFDASCGNNFNDNSLGSSAGGWNDIFIVKFNNAGAVQWATYYGGSSDDYNSALAFDNNGNLFVAGGWNAYYTSTVSTLPLTNPGNSAYFNNIPPNNGTQQPFISKFITVPVYTQVQTNPASCSCNGAAGVTVVSCAEPNYSYKWSNGVVQNNVSNLTSSINSLCPGNYWVEIKSKCMVRDTLYFNLPATGSILTANHTQTDAACNSSTGTVLLSSVTNGVPNYTIIEGSTTIASNVSTPYSITGVAVGTHTYFVTDASGCSTTFNVTISASQVITAQFSKGTSACTDCGCKEWLMINATGGTSPYTYTWPDGYDKRYKNQVCPGNYLVNIKDKNGCSVNVNLTAP